MDTLETNIEGDQDAKYIATITELLTLQSYTLHSIYHNASIIED